MTLTAEQITKALALPADVMVTASMEKIKRGEMTYDDLQELCALRMPNEVESVAKDIGIIQ